MKETFYDKRAQRIHKAYQYRRLIIDGEISVSRKLAIKLIGPDCAYHLYSRDKSVHCKQK